MHLYHERDAQERDTQDRDAYLSLSSYLHHLRLYLPLVRLCRLRLSLVSLSLVHLSLVCLCLVRRCLDLEKVCGVYVCL